MKNCVQCGAQLEDGAKFCKECGAHQPDSPNYQSYNTQANYGGATANNPGNANTMAIIALVCGIASIILIFLLPVLGLIVGIVAICLGLSAKKKLPVGQTAMATAGFIMGLVAVIVCAIMLIVLISCVGMACAALGGLTESADLSDLAHLYDF